MKERIIGTMVGTLLGYLGGIVLAAAATPLITKATFNSIFKE